MKREHRTGNYWWTCILAAILLCIVWGCGQSAYAEELTGCTSEEVVEQMGVGWNLGNTFDATGGNSSDIFSQEQSWGNPIVTKELIDAIKDEGFNTIRIPVTWYRHISSDGTYTIDEAFLERVKTVVDYAYEDGLFIILNVHHEEWVNIADLSTKYEAVGEELAAVWNQLADYFADYDQHLIFEGMNEPRMSGTDEEWTGNQEAYAAVNYLNQIFVNTVRHSKKGYNQERCLMIPGYAASSSASILESIAIPTVNGEAANNLIISVHCYSPYNFCLSDSMTDFDPEDSDCVEEIDAVFSNLQSIFLDNGIPVVIGETSATNKDNTEARERWAYYMGSKAAAYGVPIVLWDNGYNGNSGGECHAYIDRKTCTWNYPTVIQSLMDGLNSIAWGTGREQTNTDQEATIEGSTVIWSDATGLTIPEVWKNQYVSMSANASYYSEDRDVAVVYTGNSVPNLILDSAVKSQWWIPVLPNRTENVNGKKVTYFTYSDIMAAMKSYGVDDPADLRNMSVIATGDNTTVYEVCITGGDPVITCKVNGADYSVDTKLPADPTYTNMKFLGWYTTKDYQEGTEYTGGTLTEDITVYAKFQLTLDFDELFGTEDSAGSEENGTDDAQDGDVDDGKAEDGDLEDGSAEDESTEDGSAENGSTENGSAEDGSTEDSSTVNGSTEDGSAEDGSTEAGGAENGSTEDGSTENGSTEDGSAEDGDHKENSEDSTIKEPGSLNDSSEDVLWGDVDGNGTIDLKDVTLMKRFMAGWSIVIDESAADVDGNGVINLKDVAMIKRKVAGWPVVFHNYD